MSAQDIQQAMHGWAAGQQQLDAERDRLILAASAAEINVTQIARDLGISRPTVYAVLFKAADEWALQVKCPVPTCEAEPDIQCRVLDGSTREHAHPDRVKAAKNAATHNAFTHDHTGNLRPDYSNPYACDDDLHYWAPDGITVENAEGGTVAGKELQWPSGEFNPDFADETLTSMGYRRTGPWEWLNPGWRAPLVARVGLRVTEISEER